MRLSKRVACTAFVAAVALAVAPAMAEKDPYMQPDDTWISISGTVKEVYPDRFILDYGEGVVTVEMDDGDRDADAYSLLEGDKVNVSGRIDDDFYEATKIEASSVYVEKLGTYFYASALDEETPDDFITVVTPLEVSDTVVQGTVTDVKKDEFTVNTGPRSLIVSVAGMPYNPLDDEGYQKIEVGDIVSVAGTMDAEFFGKNRLMADSVTTIVD